MLTRSTVAQHGLGERDFRASVDSFVYVRQVQRHFSKMELVDSHTFLVHLLPSGGYRPISPLSLTSK